MRGLMALVLAAAMAVLPMRAANASPAATADVGNQWIQIENQWTHQCIQSMLSSYGLPAGVTQEPCDNNVDFHLKFFNLIPTRAIVGIGQLYQVHADVAPNTCLDLPNYGPVNDGTVVGLYTCASDPARDNQEFFIETYEDIPNTNGTPVYSLQNYASGGFDGPCLDVSGWASNNSDEAAGLPLTVYPCEDPSWANEGNDDHLWYLGLP